MKKLQLLAIFSFLVLIVSCHKAESFPDKYVEIKPTQVIAHKGGGDDGVYQENTLEAIKLGFQKCDGIEIDIQMNRDNSLWLFHDDFIDICDVNNLGRIATYTDAQLKEHIQCVGGSYTLTKLEDVFVYHRNNSIVKPISLDIKSWLPSNSSNSTAYVKRFADMVYELISKYNMSSYILVECENAMFLNQLKKRGFAGEIYLTTFGDFEQGMRKAIKAGYAGLSFKNETRELTTEEIDLLHRKGLKIQVWTLDEPSKIEMAIAKGADFIQTNNLDWK